MLGDDELAVGGRDRRMKLAAPFAGDCRPIALERGNARSDAQAIEIVGTEAEPDMDNCKRRAPGRLKGSRGMVEEARSGDRRGEAVRADLTFGVDHLVLEVEKQKR